MRSFLRWTAALAIIAIMLVSFLPPGKDPVVVPSVFRWGNSYWLEGEEQEAIQRNRIQRVYLKILDIDWNSANGAHPVSKVPVPYQWRSYYSDRGYWTDRVELVPCIYITNNTFLRITEEEVDELANNLLRKLRMERPEKIHGVMLDCDWSTKTKAKFFRLTRLMNDSLDVPLTVTVRLHQFAQPTRTGVPPADRGMLMPYNVGRISEPGTVNSIFDHATAEPYFKNTKPYPLPLDIGLPAFSWGVQFRKGALVGLLQEQFVNDALNAGLLGGEANGNLHVINENNSAMPELHLGDMIRVERITPETIAQVTALARTAVNSDTIAVAYFASGSMNFQQLTETDVRAGFTSFGQLRTTSVYAREDAMDSAAWSGSDSAMPTIMDTTR